MTLEESVGLEDRNEVESRLQALVERLIVEPRRTAPIRFDFPDTVVWVDENYFGAATKFKSKSGRHFSIKKSIGEIIRAIADVLQRYGIPVTTERRFLLIAHPALAEESSALGRVIGGICANDCHVPDGVARAVLFDSIVIEAWDIGTVVHELVHAMMRDTATEGRLLGDRETLELLTDSIADEAVSNTSWNDRYRGGDYIAARRQTHPEFAARNYIEDVVKQLRTTA